MNHGFPTPLDELLVHQAPLTYVPLHVGCGLFEHATVGRHDPTGFADFLSVAP